MTDREEIQSLYETLVKALAIADRIEDFVSAAFLTEIIERLQAQLRTDR